MATTATETAPTQVEGEELNLAQAFEDADENDAGGQQQLVNGEEHTPTPKPGEGEGEGEEELDENGEPIHHDEPPPDGDLELDLNAEPVIKPGDAIPDDHKILLNVDGHDVEWTYGQLKANAQKYESANHRFEEAAAIRKDAESKLAILPERERQLGQVLEYYIGQSQQFLQAQQPDWAKLLEENPTEYLKQRHGWELKQTELNQARGIQAELQRRDAEAKAASAKLFVDAEKTALVAAIPEWSDPLKAAQGARELDQYLADQGVPPEMRAQIDTAKVVLIARKAMLYDRALAKQAAARVAGLKKNQQQAHQVERPGAAQTTPTASVRANNKRANAEKTFRANPSTDTLSSFFEN